MVTNERAEWGCGMKAGDLNLLAGMGQSYINLLGRITPSSEWMIDMVELAKAETVAMTAPITPAALFAAGWVYDTGDCAYRHPRIGDHVECEFNLADEPMVSVAGWRVFANSMHDINELVRLLGGAK